MCDIVHDNFTKITSPNGEIALKEEKGGAGEVISYQRELL